MTDEPDERRAIAPHAEGAADEAADDIRRRARHRLQTEGAQIGVAVLIELAIDRLQKGSTRGAAAKSLVQLSGSAAPMPLQEDLNEMSAEQIRALLAEAERALAARLEKLKTIEHVPTVPARATDSKIEKTPPWGSLFD